MSPKRCSVKDCKAKGDKIILHGIPTSLKRQEKWKKALKTFIDDQLDVAKTLICSKHFKKADYVPSLTGAKSTLLCKSAIPSVFTTSMPKKPPPPEVVVRPRHQSRRAASKEALKQMQILLEDENDPVEIPDDDEVIPIAVVSHPKKKYKLTHRKSSDGNDREVLVLKSITPNITNHYVENNLELECWVEELEPCQKERNKKLEDEEKELQKKLDELIKACKGEVVYKGDLTTVIEVSEHVQKTIQAVQASIAKPPIVLNSAVANPQPGYQLVMDPRLGLIVGTVPSANQTATPPPKQGKIQVASNLQASATAASQTSTPPTGRRSRTKKQTPAVQPTPPPPTPISTRSLPTSRSAVKEPISTRSAPAPVVTTRSAPSPIGTRSAINTKQSNKRTASQPPVAAPPATRSRRDEPAALPPVTPPTTRSRVPAGAVTVARPTETSVEGGLSTGGRPKAIVDLTTDDGRPLPDSREISFNKLQGKTFPSLVVVARPHLRVADVNSDRGKLDGKVKSVLMYAPTKFTEWLIQQGLVKSEQKCSIHTSTQLKLGMYSDVTKFPYSGGYVWISECCPQRFVSVFSGSIFEGSPHPPLVILKILYHWSCQTNIQNVTQWVKVDNLYVKGMYTWLRSICTVALQTHIRQLGGSQIKVEVGVISLGTTSQDGNSRQVKVEVLGILETSSKLIRLRAIEPLADGDRNYKKRFSKILEPLAQWVHPSSIIVTDLTVDKATLHQMGFAAVVQTTSVDANNSNRTIMEYLRRIVPRMFQNTLSLLSRQIIQQFLDELVWREWFGTTSMQAFDNLIAHLAEQTRVESNQSLIVKLNRVALNPFKNWGVAATSTATTTTVPAAAPSVAPKAADPATKKRKRKEVEPPKPAATPASEPIRPPKSNSPDVPEQMVPLENYYYGTIDNYPPKTNVTLNMKCPFCKEMFNNNIVLMNHLFKHAHNVSNDGQMCRYCLTSVPTANDLLKHIATAHPSETKHDNGFVCLICETQYMNPFVLGKHMSKEHCPSELPYQCGTCGYKCSNHKQAIDHFYKQHDNGPTIQCPFCLKSTTVFSSSRNIAQNMHYFIQHLQKHQRKQYARRCGKCNLWFVQKDVLKEHQTKMHATQRGKTGLVPWIAPRNGVMVPKSKMDKYPCDAEGINFSTLFFNVSKNLKCKECDGLMDTPKHFPSFESCQNPNCQYSTCCSNAMQEHNAKCSKNSQPNVPDEKLPYEMFCICGYSSLDGNQTAKHLTVCERKSAYPSLSDAKSASVTHSMLDVLGLVRRPEETEKKQTAISRTAKRTPQAKIEKEPETITLDEEGPSDTGIIKEIKKDEIEPGTEELNKTITTDNVTESMEVDTSKEGIDESEDINKRPEISESGGIKSGRAHKESDETETELENLEKEPDTVEIGTEATEKEPVIIEKETDRIEREADTIEKEEDTIEKEADTIEKEADTVEKETDTIAKETDTIEKETEIIEKETDTIEKETDAIENETDTIDKETDIIEKETDKIEKEADEVDKETDTIEKEADEVDKETDTIEKEADAEEKEPETNTIEPTEVNERGDDAEDISDTDISMTEQTQTSIESAEISNSEGKQSDEPPLTDATSSHIDTEGKDTEALDGKEIEEEDLLSERPAVEELQTLDEAASPADDDQSKKTEVEKSQLVSNEGNDMSDKTDAKESELTEPEDDFELPKSSEMEQSHTDEDYNTQPENSVSDSIENSKDNETDQDTEVSQDSEPTQKSQTENDQSLDEKDDTPADIDQRLEEQIDTPSDDNESLDEKPDTPANDNQNLDEEVYTPTPADDNQSLDEKVDAPTVTEDVPIRDRDSETNKDQDAPVTERNVGECSNDQFEDTIMGRINKDADKELENIALAGERAEEECSNEFENISDRDENASQLPDVSSPVDDLPSSTPGVYDDVSESSDNAASKYLEEPESAQNLCDSEQAGDMEVDQTENRERAIDAMDYEDISNTGLDTMSSMDTD